MNNFSNKLILASASPRRKFLLSKMGLEFDVVVSDAEESNDCKIKTPKQIAMHNAQIKALAVSEKYPDSLVLGSDTIVVLNGEVLGKPKDKTDAINMLSKLSENTHTVISAVCLVCKKSNFILNNYEESFVKFNKLTKEIISDYISKVDVMDKAGSYAIQENKDMIIADIDGNLDNVMGLPCTLVAELLKRFESSI